MMLRRSALAIAVIAAVLFAAAPASAEPGPIQLVSKSPFEQADSASATALSAAGRYLAFQGSIGGRSGVFREDLTSGAVLAVATATAGGPAPADAAAPSISADGRYVSFTTSAALDPSDDANGADDVYVADMASSPPTYELASALDGSTAGLTYGGPGGAQASGRVALSADGRELAFFTTAASDLTSGPSGSTPGEETPAGQVAVRDLATDRTTLVSAERDPKTGAMTDLPVAGGAMILKPQAPPPGAALSADGSTVAWLAGHLPAQVPLLPGESEAIAQLDALDVVPYDEPLWRRVADGPAAPTRRIIGGGDLSFPAMTNKADDLNPAASGWLGLQRVDGTPQLSADGDTVALIGNPTEAANVFLASMDPGLSRTQAVRRLTRETPVNPNQPNRGINLIPTLQLNGHIFDLTISADGRRLAFTTARQQFPLAPPNLVTPPPGQVGLVELYLVDLEGETLQRVTHGTGGEGEASLAPSIGNNVNGDGAGSPSFDAGAGLIAFSSSASNLVAGDGNEASDAFTVTATSDDRSSAPVRISPGPRRRGKKRAGFTLSAFSLPHGGVRLVASVPGPGSFWVQASSPPSAGAVVSKAPRTLAQGRRRARRGGSVKLDLVLPPHLRHLAHTREGVYAIARAGFHRRGRKTLHAQLQVRFHAHPAKKKRGR
jgi:hypothetical protein